MKWRILQVDGYAVYENYLDGETEAVYGTVCRLYNVPTWAAYLSFGELQPGLNGVPQPNQITAKAWVEAQCAEVFGDT